MDKFVGNCKTDKSPLVQKFLASSPLSPQNIDQLRQNIRQECKMRLRNKRRELFNKNRQDLVQIVSNEFQKISFNFQQEVHNRGFLFDEIDLRILQNVEEDILNEQVDWFNDEMTQIIDQYENIDDQCSRLNAIICPLCLTGILTQVNNIILCDKCKSCLCNNMPLEDFKLKLDFVSELHQKSCSSSPSFTLVPNEFNSPSLLLMCMKCQICCSV